MKQLLPPVMRTLIILGILSHSLPSVASNETTTDVRAFALGGVNALSLETINPAAIAFQSGIQAGISITNRFETTEFNTTAGHFTAPNRLLDVGFRFSTFGYEDYRITDLQSIFARRVTQNLSIGINIHYSILSSVLEEKYKSGLSGDLGICFRPGSSIELVLLIRNILHSFECDHVRYHAGINYPICKGGNLLFEVASDYRSEYAFSLGMEYELAENFLVRGGLHTQPDFPTFGASYSWKGLQFDLGFQLHSDLGASSAIGMKYFFK